jgi:hypothetical protein
MLRYIFKFYFIKIQYNFFIFKNLTVYIKENKTFLTRIKFAITPRDRKVLSPLLASLHCHRFILESFIF